MATLKLVIVKSKPLKDGKHKIRVAVYHKQTTFYIATKFVVDENQFKNGQVVKRPDASSMNMKLRQILNEYQERIDSIRNISIYTSTQLKNILEQKNTYSNVNTFQKLNHAYIDELKSDDRNGYAEMLERNGRYFKEYTKEDILLEDITPELIDGYANFLRKKKKLSDTTNSMMLRNTRTIINRGIKKRLVKYDVHPFIDFKVPTSAVRELDLSLEDFNKIRNSNPDRKRFKMVRDLFCLSFYLGGINLIDLLNIDFRDLHEIKYTRQKTILTKKDFNEIRISIPSEARAIIDEWINKKNGKLDFGYKFSYKNFLCYVSRTLASFAKSIGIKNRVVYYSARKSFAQYASDLGISDSIIDYCLGHSDKRRGVIYFYAKIKKQQADAAISKIIDYVNNPEKYEDYIQLKRDIMMMR